MTDLCFIAVTVALGLLQLGDWYTTRTVLKQGGSEANPIIRKAFQYFNVDAVLATKAIAVTAISYWGNLVYVSAAGVVLYLWVVWHNYKLIK